MNNTNLEWKKIEVPIWQPLKEGDEINGTLISREENVGQYKNNTYKIETFPGSITLVFGKKVLDDLLKNVKVGTLIRIVFKGKKGKANLFDVYTK